MWILKNISYQPKRKKETPTIPDRNIVQQEVLNGKI